MLCLAIATHNVKSVTQYSVYIETKYLKILISEHPNNWFNLPLNWLEGVVCCYHNFKWLKMTWNCKEILQDIFHICQLNRHNSYVKINTDRAFESQLGSKG